ncbi:MAG: hypothetical protein V9E94_12165 [Microthrixaceae bacterium]
MTGATFLTGAAFYQAIERELGLEQGLLQPDASLVEDLHLDSLSMLMVVLIVEDLAESTESAGPATPLNCGEDLYSFYVALRTDATL